MTGNIATKTSTHGSFTSVAVKAVRGVSNNHLCREKNFERSNIFPLLDIPRKVKNFTRQLTLTTHGLANDFGNSDFQIQDSTWTQRESSQCLSLRTAPCTLSPHGL